MKDTLFPDDRGIRIDIGIRRLQLRHGMGEGQGEVDGVAKSNSLEGFYGLRDCFIPGPRLEFSSAADWNRLESQVMSIALSELHRMPSVGITSNLPKVVLARHARTITPFLPAAKISLAGTPFRRHPSGSKVSPDSKLDSPKTSFTSQFGLPFVSYWVTLLSHSILFAPSMTSDKL